VTGVSDSEPGRASDPDPGDHYRANGDGPFPTGYYRVVGRDADEVLLLHVGDAEDRRRHTGRVESVDRSRLAALQSAEPPGSTTLAGTAGVVEALWLSVRTIPANLRERPGQLLLGAVLLVAAAVGPAILTFPPVLFVAANLLGALLVGAAAAGLPR
jgi:hypothetical protein